MKIKDLAYSNVGCFATNDGCQSDAFVETLTQTQCSLAAASFPVAYCGSCGSYNYLKSDSSMTIELCLQICAQANFTYSGIWK